MFIKDHENLQKLSPEIQNLKYEINNKNYQNSILIIDSLFEKLSEISGTEEFANRLDDLYSLVDSEEIDENKISDASSEVFILFDKEVNWRKDAAQNLVPELENIMRLLKII